MVKEEIKQSKQSKESQAMEFFKIAYIQKVIVFELDNKLIVGINTVDHEPHSQSTFIALNSISRQKKKVRCRFRSIPQYYFFS